MTDAKFFDVFYNLINSLDGDYIFKAQLAAAMKPEGW